MSRKHRGVHFQRHQGGSRKRRFRRVWGGLYLLLTAVFLIGYAAAYLPPRWFWWTGLVAVSVPYTSLLLVLLAPLVFWRSGTAGRVVHSVLLLLIALRFVLPMGSPGRTPERPGDLVLMTFNAPVRGPHPDTLRAAMLHLIRHATPDVLALQEPVAWWDSTSQRHRMTGHAQALLDSLGYVLFTPAGDSLNRFEQPVLVRAGAGLRIKAVEQIVLSPAKGADTPTYITRLRCRWRNRSFVLYNLHLYTTGARKPWLEEPARPFDPLFWRPYVKRYREAYQRRAWEVQQVRMLLEQETLPVIVVGDFNSTMHHWEYRQLARGLRDAFTRRGRGWGATYHARLPLVRIDHVLTSPAWEIVTAHVPRSHAFSDHRPVVVRLRWGE